MKERMISCKHCGEQIRPDEEKCPYCNKALAVDYASLYPAYPNKKYYLHMSTSPWGRIPLLGVFAFCIVGLIWIIVAVFSVTEMKPGAWIMLLPVCGPCLLGVVWLTLSVFAMYSSYMIWDGGDTIEVRIFKKTRKYSVSSVGALVQNVISNGKVTKVRYIVVSKNGTPMCALHANQDTRDFFRHFGIKETVDNEMQYNDYSEKFFGR